MNVQFFGEFLVDRWMITQQQLAEALQLQEYRNIRFGQLAVERKRLTWEQVERIHDLQKIQNVYFADLAVGERLITAYEARQILMLQRASHLYLGEALLELGYLREDNLDRELSIYHEENQRRIPAEPAGKQVGVWYNLVNSGVELTEKMLVRLAGPSVKVGKGIFLRPESKPNGDENELISVVVGFRGSLVANYVLSLAWLDAGELASRFLKQNAVDITKARIEEAMRNLFAIICDHMIGDLKKAGADLGVESPIVLPAPPRLSEGTKTIYFPIRLNQSVLDLRFMAYQA